MFALNETAIFYECVGRQGGRPVYAEDGAAFRCRSESAWGPRFSGSAVERVADTRIFANVAPEAGALARFDPRPGDRIVLNGRNYRVAEVQPMRGWREVHHLEILAKDEGLRPEGE